MSRLPSAAQIRFIFLDRDGVINRKLPENHYVRTWSDFEILPGVESAIAALNRGGSRVIVITNQRGVALGFHTLKDVDDIHDRLQSQLAQHGARIDAFYICPHDKNQCKCRKPATGLFEQALRDFPAASAANTIVIGDSISDIQAACAMGMPSIFIQGDPTTQKSGSERAAALANAVFPSLSHAVAHILTDRSEATGPA